MKYEMIERNGKSFVVLPVDMFYQLMEDAEMIDDIKAFDEAKAEGGEYYPASVVYAILNGQNPIKTYREYRTLTQEDLAVKTGLSRAYIAQLETGKRTGSIAALKGIAQVLMVDLEDIV